MEKRVNRPEQGDASGSGMIDALHRGHMKKVVQCNHFPSSRLRESGMTLVEVLIAAVAVTFIGIGSIEVLTMCEKFSAQARLYTNARVVVQRNLDTAAGVLFSGTTTAPVVLQTTGASGTTCDDDGGSPTENISVLLTGTNNSLVSGTLTRIVTPLPASSFPSDVGTPVVMSVTFRVDWNYRSTPYTFSETTLRSQDNQ